MRRLILICAALLAAGLLTSPTAAATHATTPSLRLLGIDPLKVGGAHFASRERVELTTSSGRSAWVRASRTGSFIATFPGAQLGRCGGGVSVHAAGRRGSSAFLKIPRPACMPVRSGASTS